MLKVLNFNCDVFSGGNACSFKYIVNTELYKSVCFDGRSVSQLFSHPFIYDSHCFSMLWRSQWFLITLAEVHTFYFQEARDGAWHFPLPMNILLCVLEVDLIESAEIQANVGVKYLTLVNQLCGENFHLKNSIVGASGHEIIKCGIILLAIASESKFQYSLFLPSFYAVFISLEKFFSQKY